MKCLDMRKVTVCISLYKKSMTQLTEAIRSVPVEWPILLSIDGGWDYKESDIGYILKRFHGNETDDIIFYRENVGLATVRNEQIAYKGFTTSKIMFLDADDVLRVRERFADVNIELDDYAMKDLIVTVVLFNSNDKLTSDWRNIGVVNGTGQSLFVIPSCVFDYRYLRAHNLYFDESGYAYEDVIFSVKLTELIKSGNCNVGISRAPWYQYNLPSSGDGTLSTGNDKRVIDSTRHVIDNLRLLPRSMTVYSRIVEESLRLLQFNIEGLNTYVIENLKPYKYFKS